MAKQATKNNIFSTLPGSKFSIVVTNFAAQIVIREFSAPLQKRCLSLSKGFPLQPKFAAAAAQRFYSSFVALLEAILQRCSFRTGGITDIKYPLASFR